MDSAAIRNWVFFFACIITAVLAADTLAGLIIRTIGLSGWIAFLANFILYAAFIFGILGIFEKIFQIGFFQFTVS